MMLSANGILPFAFKLTAFVWFALAAACCAWTFALFCSCSAFMLQDAMDDTRLGELPAVRKQFQLAVSHGRRNGKEQGQHSGEGPHCLVLLGVLPDTIQQTL